MLEEWAREGIPAGKSAPAGPAELARWADPELCLTPWGSPNVASPNGPYPDLRARFDRATRLIHGDGGGSARALEKRVRDLEEKNRQLGAQVLEQIHRIQTLSMELERRVSLEGTAMLQAVPGDLQGKLRPFPGRGGRRE